MFANAGKKFWKNFNKKSKYQNKSKHSKRKYSTTENTEQAKQQSEAEQPKQQPPQPSGSEIKTTQKRLTKTNRVLRTYLGITAASTLAAIAYNLYDFQPSNNLGKVTAMLRGSSEETILEGLDSLNECFYITKRVFSGKVAIPISSTLIEAHENELVHALIQASTHTSAGIRWRSLSWLSTLASQHHSIRTQLVLQDKLSIVSEFANKVVTGGGEHNEWLIASNILLQVVSDKDLRSRLSDADRKSIEKVTNQLWEKNNDPLALFVAAQLSEQLGSPLAVTGYGGDLGKKLLNAALKETMAATRTPIEQYTGAGFFSILINSVIAGGWGMFWWRARRLGKGITEPGIKKWVQTLYFGRNLFILLMFDMIAQRFMKYVSTETLSLDLKRWNEQLNNNKNLLVTKVAYDIIKEGNHQFAINQPPPLSSVYPIVQTAIFGLGTMALLRTQRFVFLPLLLAGLYNHRDVVEESDAFQYIAGIVTSGQVEMPKLPKMDVSKVKELVGLIKKLTTSTPAPTQKVEAAPAVVEKKVVEEKKEEVAEPAVVAVSTEEKKEEEH